MFNTKFLITLLFLSFTLYTLASDSDPIKDTEKITLSYLELNDSSIEFAVHDVNSMILRKNKGYLWPATKITLSKDDDKLIFVITAIDNSWYNMFSNDETTHGYFTVNGRLFIVATKGEIPEEFNNIFEHNPEIKEKSFSKTDSKLKPVSKSPVWTYLYKGGYNNTSIVIKSVYTENLGR
jgi:hypothetical protein